MKPLVLGDLVFNTWHTQFFSGVVQTRKRKYTNGVVGLEPTLAIN